MLNRRDKISLNERQIGCCLESSTDSQLKQSDRNSPSHSFREQQEYMNELAGKVPAQGSVPVLGMKVNCLWRKGESPWRHKGIFEKMERWMCGSSENAFQNKHNHHEESGTEISNK